MAVKEGSIVVERPQRHNRRKPNQQILDRYDQDLLRAKNAQEEVIFSLAVDTDFTTTEECIVRAHVLEVGKFSIKVETTHPRAGHVVWLAKAFIVGTEVQR